MPPSDLGQFLAWIGSNAAIGMVISWIMANWAWFQGRASGEKTIILYVVAVVMGVVSRLALTYIPAGIIGDLQPYYTILLTSAIIVGGQQLYYYKLGGKTQAQGTKAVAYAKKNAKAAGTLLANLDKKLMPTVETDSFSKG
jgi:hypothetical protein